MNRVTLCKVFVHDQDEALDFYTKKLGSEWPKKASLATTAGCSFACLRISCSFACLKIRSSRLNLDVARSEEQKALIGRQAATAPLLRVETDDCMRGYHKLKARGVEFEGEPETQPYGTGVLLKDLYGNRIYLNQD
jgi:uncharacterized glyoxalase superfamily protein PhnB